MLEKTIYKHKNLEKPALSNLNTKYFCFPIILESQLYLICLKFTLERYCLIKYASQQGCSQDTFCNDLFSRRESEQFCRRLCDFKILFNLAVNTV